MESIWIRETALPEFPAVSRDMDTETLIVGGGMAGLLCGYFLHQQHQSFAVMEKDRIGAGITAHTTGKITSQQGLIYRRLIKEFGTETASAYRQGSEKALEMYRQMAKTIDCDFEDRDNYVYSVDNKRAVLEEMEALSRIGGKGIYTEDTELPFEIAAAIRTPGQAQFHPLKFIKAISEAQRENIFEHSFVQNVEKTGDGYRVSVVSGGNGGRGERRSNNGEGGDGESGSGDGSIGGRTFTIHAKRVIIAAHFPFLDRWGMYFMKLYQSRSFVLALEGKSLPQLEGMYISDRQAKGSHLNLSLRKSGDYLLLGGGGGRTGSRYAGLEELRRQAKLLFSGSTEAAAWSAQDCMSLDGLPYIGQYTRNQEGLQTAAGFNKWGMTGAMTAAMVLTGQFSDEIAEIYSPARRALRPQLFINTFETAKNFLRPTAPRCRHLGCALKWNRAEQSWDCPCHGSTFAKDGRVIHNPSQKPIE